MPRFQKRLELRWTLFQNNCFFHKVIFEEKIDTQFLLKNNITINDYLSKVINTRVWIDDKLSIEKDSISLLTVFLNPEDDDLCLFVASSIRLITQDCIKASILTIPVPVMSIAPKAMSGCR